MLVISPSFLSFIHHIPFLKAQHGMDLPSCLSDVYQTNNYSRVTTVINLGPTEAQPHVLLVIKLLASWEDKMDP